jgi:AraC-like DNA-binding protein
MSRPPVHLRLVPSPTASARAKRPDPLAQAAVTLMSGDLGRPWTVSALAKGLAVSRPVLARRFREALGTSPMRWLSARRMEQAAELVRVLDQPLVHVAELVGYSSEFAFNRAFKRHHGVAPGSFRRAQFTMLRAAA